MGFFKQLAVNGHEEDLEKLLVQRPDRALTIDACGKTLLHHAAENGRVLTVDLLYQKGCGMYKYRKMLTVNCSTRARLSV